MFVRVIVFSALLLTLPSPAFPSNGEAVFGSRETMSSNMKAFSRWTEMWRRHNMPSEEQIAKAKKKKAVGNSAFKVRIPTDFRARRDKKALKNTGQNTGQKAAGAENTVKCSRFQRLNCKKEAWDNFIKEHQKPLTLELLMAVNQYMNLSPYIVDPVNWGVPDYWATPTEFFLKDGDCEDYAISKYITLKRMGVDPDIMRLVIVQDENLRIAHAVLAVTLDEEIFILDNQINSVLSHKKISHYRPVYSINESAWWLHQR